MKYLLALFLSVFTIISCDGSNPASEETAVYNPKIHTLEKIELSNGYQTLVLATSNTGSSTSSKSLNSTISTPCDEIGEIDDGLYRKIATQGNLTPCFSEIRRFAAIQLYGKYRPNDSSYDVWFITDSSGKVHHLPNAPKKGAGFKNDHIIKFMSGKPLYLDYLSRLIRFDFGSGLEETVINEPVGYFVILKKDNGDHIFYTDLTGGQRRRPNGTIDRLSKLDTRRFFFEDMSGDLGYVNHNGYFKRITLDQSGIIINDSSTAVPESYAAWLENPLGQPEPQGSYFNGAMEGCERSENLIICGTLGFVIGGNEQDLKAVDWNNFEIYGASPKICLTDNYIYFSAGDKLTQIARDLQIFEHILTGEQIIELSCQDDDSLLIKTDSQVYEFRPSDKTKTILFPNITAFIK